MELYMTRTLSGLSPADDLAKDALRRIKVGKTVKCEILRPRNIKHHRLFFAMLQTIYMACGQFASVEDLLIELKLKLGLTKDVVIRESGEVVKILGSISFAKMSQDEFNVFFERALIALCEIAGGIESDMLREEVLRQVAA